MNKYKYLIFDLDDTIFDFQKSESEALEILFDEYNIPFNQSNKEKYKKINRMYWDKLESGDISMNEVLTNRFRDFFAIFGIETDGEEIETKYRSLLKKSCHLIPFAKESILSLKNRGYIIIAGSNGIGKNQRLKLEKCGISNYFDDIFVSDELGYDKPSIGFYNHIFDKFPDMNINNSIMIGDSLGSDIQGAINANIDSIWYNNKGIKSDNIKSTYETDDIRRIVEILSK